MSTKRLKTSPDTSTNGVVRMTRADWEKILWNAGNEWIIDKPYWKKIWKEKAPKSQKDEDEQLLKPGIIIPAPYNVGFALLSMLKKPTWYDMEICTFSFNRVEADGTTKVDKRKAISSLLELMRSDYHGKRAIFTTNKKSFIDHLIREGFADQTPDKTLKTLFIHFPQIKKRKQPTIVHHSTDIYEF